MQNHFGSAMNMTEHRNYTILFPFEESFNKHEYKAWMDKHWSWSVYAGVMYVIMVFGGQELMKSKSAYQLRPMLVLWNTCLAVFSLLGALRTVPELAHVLWGQGFHSVVCSRSYVEDNRVSGFWGWLFAVSKMAELMDTAFVVLRKQNLIFLHWYHHLTTLVYSWAVYTDHPSIARTHIFLNYSVHAFMYFYYVLRALQIRTPRWFAMFITTSQIVQLVIGSAVAFYAFWLKMSGRECGVSERTATLSTLIYVTLMCLFVRFFYLSYYVNNKTIRQKNA